MKYLARIDLCSDWGKSDQINKFYRIIDEIDDYIENSTGNYFDTPLTNFCGSDDQKKNVLYVVAAAYDGFRKISIDRSKLVLSDCSLDTFRDIDLDKAWMDYLGALESFLLDKSKVKCAKKFDILLHSTLKNPDYVKSLIIIGISDNLKDLYDVYEIIKSTKNGDGKKELEKQYNNFKFTANNPIIGFSSRHAGRKPENGQINSKKKISLSEAKLEIYGLLRNEINEKYNFKLTESRSGTLNTSEEVKFDKNITL